MRKHRRHASDLNQPDFIHALKQIGCTVECIGEPVDLLVGYRKRNFLIECKSPKGALTPTQKKFFADWKGQVRKCKSAEEAIKLVTESYKVQ